MVRILPLLLMLLVSLPAAAATSLRSETTTVSARLLTAADGVGDGVSTLSAGLQITLAPGWKTYWRSPGEVGLPPQISWEGSENVAEVMLAYPAPTRFTAFEIENFGYGEEVVFPLTVKLGNAGAAARLNLRADLLVCADVCIPETVITSLELPTGGGHDADSAKVMSEWVARVPVAAEDVGLTVERVHLDDDTLTLSAVADPPLSTPDVFPEQGPYAVFGKPEIRLTDGGKRLWAQLPVLAPGEGPFQLTIVDGRRAATLEPALASVAPPPPGDENALIWMVLFAFLGGIILNVMPCVLPVLSIKLASALQARDKTQNQVRAGFLASAAGVMVFFLGLAGAIIGLRMAGVAVGWGVQFQNPVFLAVMIGLMALFAANLAGLFEIGLSSQAQTSMGRIEGRRGLGGDFATGAFAAVMATPCSAPFLGTAVTYALTRGASETLAIFAAMGVGLALPYLLVALRPAVIKRLPRPGAWMVGLRRILGGLMAVAALWLVTVLASTAGWTIALGVAFAAVGMVVAIAVLRRALPLGAAGLALVAALALLLPSSGPAPAQVSGPWEPFDRARISAEIAAGRVVFVDVTADWCLTCKVNKRLVLDTALVAERLAAAETIALRADWTRPDDGIAAYLRENGRFGIPFNAVYGPSAPEGIPLPEFLTEAAVMEALTQAGG